MKNSCSGIKEDWCCKGKSPWKQHALKGQKLLSPGHRPGCLWAQTCRPVRAKALKYLAIYKAFALTGRLADCYYTQGDALG